MFLTIVMPHFVDIQYDLTNADGADVHVQACKCVHCYVPQASYPPGTRLNELDYIQSQDYVSRPGRRRQYTGTAGRPTVQVHYLVLRIFSVAHWCIGDVCR